MKVTKRRKVVWGLIAVFFLATALSKDLTKTVFQVSSPNKKLAARVTESAGWGRFFYGSKYQVELRNTQTNERASVMEQSQIEGWHSFSPAGIKWESNNQRFHCDWWIHEHGEKMSYSFKVKQNPLAVTKLDGGGHTH